MNTWKYLKRYGFADWTWLYGYGINQEVIEDERK